MLWGYRMQAQLTDKAKSEETGSSFLHKEHHMMLSTMITNPMSDLYCSVRHQARWYECC